LESPWGEKKKERGGGKTLFRDAYLTAAPGEKHGCEEKRKRGKVKKTGRFWVGNVDFLGQPGSGGRTTNCPP